MLCNAFPWVQGGEVTDQQCCYLPIAPDGAPVMGRLPAVGGAYVCTGHGCWGILNAPATGEAMAALIMNEKPPVDISALTLARLYAHA
jgi:glycine/D-amino acid oxidase-like deaminating enzyme